MTSDLQALLAAIVADPADDTARLVYADCLEEHGNSARAEFIRLQVEAERFHPDSNTRAHFDREARAPFRKHWGAWWREVCDVVGLPWPKPKTNSRFGRLANNLASTVLGVGPSPAERDNPYGGSGFAVEPVNVPDDQSLGGFWQARFRRGFPDDLHLTGSPRHALAWSRVSPLHSLTLSSATADDWIDGPHLACVRELNLCGCDPWILECVLRSPHVANLHELRLETGTYFWAEEFVLCGSAVVPRAQQLLRKLSVPVDDRQSAERLADAPALAGLTALQVWVPPNNPVQTAECLSVLARSPHLAGLTELTIFGDVPAAGIAAVIRNPTWAGLRKLELDPHYNLARLEPLCEPDGVPELTELGLCVDVRERTVSLLTRSPLLKRLRYFRLGGFPVDLPALPGLADAVDPDRIRMFTLSIPPHGLAGVGPLRRRLGRKFRVSWVGNY